jgi:predicted MPP superfamily phosphohydrolase
MIAALSRLAPRDASVAVLGNHDHWTRPDVIRRVLRTCGIIDLSNSVHTLSRGGAKLHIAGIDDYMVGWDRLDLVLKQLAQTNGAAILLAHEPDFADLSARSRRFDLQLSGHSHGGQICLPRLGPPFLPRYARKYPSGFYQVDG